MMYPLVLELRADGFPIQRSCAVLGFTPQAFYKWQAQPYSDRDWHDARLVNVIVNIHVDAPTLGYRFIAAELHKRGIEVSEGQVQRLCHDHEIFSIISRKARKRPPADPPACSDLVRSDFTAAGPNQ